MNLQTVRTEEIQGMAQFAHAGLYARPVFLNFLLQKKLAPPVCYLATEAGQTFGHAVLSKTDIEWKFILGEKNLFTMKTSGIALRNAFNDLSQVMLEQLSKQDVLRQHQVDAMLLFSIPTDYLADTKKLVLNHSSGFVRYMPRGSSSHYYIEIKGSFEQYIANFSANSRQTLRKKVRRFSKRCNGEAHVHCYENEGDLDFFFYHALAISRKTYQHKLLGAGLDASLEFKEYLGFLARNGFLRAYILFDGDNPVAYLYSTLIDGRFETHKTGYDPDYAGMSPGTVLYYHVIEKLFNENQARIVDFSTGAGPLKQLFSTNFMECVDVYYIRKSFKPVTIVILHAFFSECVDGMRSLMEKAGLKEKLKRFFRTR